MDKLAKKLKELESRTDYRTFAAIDGLTRQLKKKADWIDSYGDDREAILDEIKWYGYPINEEQVKRIEAGNLSVNITVRPDFFEPNIYGRHLSGLPINLIAANHDSRNTECHEQMHNFFYDQANNQPNDIETMRNGLERTAQSLDQHPSPDTNGGKESLLSEIKEVDTGRALNSLKDELLAELERKESDWESQPVDWEKRFPADHDAEQTSLEDEFTRLTENYSTAGIQAETFVHTLRQISERVDLDDGETDLARTRYRNFMRQFVRAVNGLKTGSLVGGISRGSLRRRLRPRLRLPDGTDAVSPPAGRIATAVRARKV